jgi:hypothetical protein
MERTGPLYWHIVLCFGLFLIFIFDFNAPGAFTVMLPSALAYFIIPAYVFYSKGQQANIIIKINKDGIYYYGKLITEWNDFDNAYINDKMALGSFSDNFVLVIEHYRGDLLYRKNIPLTNTQNQSEEDVYHAIMYFYKEHQRSLTQFAESRPAMATESTSKSISEV